jgi:hypothetical protein
VKVLGCDVLRAQFFNQIGGLLERHVTIIIAVNEEHAAAPGRDVCNRIRLRSGLRIWAESIEA